MLVQVSVNYRHVDICSGLLLFSGWYLCISRHISYVSISCGIYGARWHSCEKRAGLNLQRIIRMSGKNIHEYITKLIFKRPEDECNWWFVAMTAKATLKNEMWQLIFRSYNLAYHFWLFYSVWWVSIPFWSINAWFTILDLSKKQIFILN